MNKLQILPWTEPLEMAAALRGQPFALFYSGARTAYSGRYSLLAWQPAETIQAESFTPLKEKLTATNPTWQNAWFGYLAYELLHSLETIPQTRAGIFPLPRLHFTRYNHIARFDHETQTIELFSEHETPPCLSPEKPPAAYHAEVYDVRSNMTGAEYLEKVARIIGHIHEGTLYQANLTRKFRGRFKQPPDSFGLFCRLCALSPAPYSAYVNLGHTAILSSSPEQFLHISPQGHITTRPIKGTAPRGQTPESDAALRHQLAHSEKDKAENLMIVDLMRNDLARSSAPGSVKVSQLFDITSHSNVHHMSSRVEAEKEQRYSTLEAISAAFPPGSMTGAPKIMAMKLCAELEELQRGVYSGALGWLGGDGSAELSVVIRTLIMNSEQFEFQVGGGIVADSVPERELQETIDKSKALLTLLHLSEAIFTSHAPNA